MYTGTGGVEAGPASDTEAPLVVTEGDASLFLGAFDGSEEEEGVEHVGENVVVSEVAELLLSLQ